MFYVTISLVSSSEDVIILWRQDAHYIMHIVYRLLLYYVKIVSLIYLLERHVKLTTFMVEILSHRRQHMVCLLYTSRCV